MTPLNEKRSHNSFNDDYNKANQMINRAIADMQDGNHIEYGSTMERKAPPPKWKNGSTRCCDCAVDATWCFFE